MGSSNPSKRQSPVHVTGLRQAAHEGYTITVGDAPYRIPARFRDSVYTASADPNVNLLPKDPQPRKLPVSATDEPSLCGMSCRVGADTLLESGFRLRHCDKHTAIQ